MMLAASDPEETGPIVINGAPMSYWGGAWRDGEGDNPMRYAGGLLGGTWLASLAADLGHGRFDGAWLVQNFANLNPANTSGTSTITSGPTSTPSRRAFSTSSAGGAASTS